MVRRVTYFIKNSKVLRTKQTVWEEKLWHYLRAGRMNDFKFKRQVVIDNIIVDFCCNEAKLIIELDGNRHRGLLSDKERDYQLKQKGYQVLRFWNSEVEKNLENILNKIQKILE